jgi:recombination protein RecR
VDTHQKTIHYLTSLLAKWPGLGPRSAQRVVFHLVNQSDGEIRNLISAIGNLKKKVTFCSICYNITEQDPCYICSDPGRDRSIITVVEKFNDIYLFEKIRKYRGLYHVLGGSISPLDNIVPENLRINELENRVRKNRIQEIIIATNPTVEGETTALYISRLLKPFDVTISRIGMGMPVGGDFDHVDEVTLAKALENRKLLNTA